MRTPRWLKLLGWHFRGVLFLLPATLMAQQLTSSLTLSINSLSSARIYIAPQSPDPVERVTTDDLGSALSASLAWRYEFAPALLAHARVEYIGADEERLDRVGTALLTGYRAGALEAGVLFALPFGGSSFRMLVGGGGGLYTAHRRLATAGVTAESTATIPVFDIHVLISAEYFPLRSLAVRADLLFRDPQIPTENAYAQSSVRSNGITYPLKTEPFRSTVNLNGNVYSLGLAWYY